MVKLLITIEDVALLSSFDGNIDNDTINPIILMAQNSEIKRLLGIPLYEKITANLDTNTLAGSYLKIYTDYVVPIHVYYTCSIYLQLGIAKVSQNGAFLVTPDKTEQIFDDKTNKMADKYEKLAVGMELQLIDYLNTLTLPEWISPDSTKAKSSFNWIKI